MQRQGYGVRFQDLYTSGAYAAKHPSWHVEESPWKANEILRLLRRHRLAPRQCLCIPRLPELRAKRAQTALTLSAPSRQIRIIHRALEGLDRAEQSCRSFRLLFGRRQDCQRLNGLQQANGMTSFSSNGKGFHLH